MDILDNNAPASSQTEMDERIERFLRGRMSLEEANAFRAEMKSNETLRERAVLLARLIKQMREVGAEQQQRVVDAMQAVDKETIRQIAAGKGAKLMQPKKTLSRRLRPWVAIAAMFCMLVLVGKFAVSPNSQRNFYGFASSILSGGKSKKVNVQVKELPKTVVRTRHDKLEELALLRGKIDMGLDLKQSTKRLQAIYDRAKQKKDTLYAPFINDIAFALAEGYNKTGNKDKEKAVLDEMLSAQDGTEVADK